MTRYSLFTAGLVSVASSAVAHAHPGHGEPGDDYSLLHYATEPLHVGTGLCLLVGALLLWNLIRASSRRRRRQESTS
ncbi:MAG: hypothetical protein WD070_05300 [Pirellulaceae bacterium]